MQLVIKIIVSVIVILVATAVAKRVPSAAGLIAVMPLTGALVLVFVYLENKGNPQVMQEFARGALWGILPSILFFVVALLCFKRNLSLPIVLVSSFAVWVGAACLHQFFLK